MRRMTRLLCLMLLFSLITFSCPLAEETDAPTGTPAPTPMLPAVPEFVKNIDIEARKILVTPIEGMFTEAVNGDED